MVNNNDNMISNKDKIADVTFVLSVKNGFDRVSIKQIQEESGLTTGSIYYHFKDKDEILLYIVNRYLINSIHIIIKKIRDLDGSLMEKIGLIFNYEKSPIIKEVESLDILNKFPIDYSEYWLLYTSIFHQHPEIRHLFYELYDELYEFLYDLIQEAIEKKEIRDDIDIEELVTFIKTNLKGYLVVIVCQPNFSAEKLLNANMKLIWEAVKKR